MRIWGRSEPGAMKMLICTPPKGGLGLGMGPLWDPSIRIPVRRTPARRRPAPPWPPTEPQIKKMRQVSAAAPTTRALGQVVLDLEGPSWSVIPGLRALWAAAGAVVVVVGRPPARAAVTWPGT